MDSRARYGAASWRGLPRLLVWPILVCAGCSLIVPASCQSESILRTKLWKPNNKNNVIDNNLPMTDIATMQLTLTRNYSDTIFTNRRKIKESDKNKLSTNGDKSRDVLVPQSYFNEMDNAIDDDDDDDLLVGHTNKPYELSVPWKRYRSKNRHEEGRDKRGVAHLYNMISCATGCDPIAYKGYGCYCGFLGSGRVIDGIDRCCKMHDRCYEGVHCPLFTVYFQPYLWRCFGGKPLCALENHESSHKLVGGCAARLCECDRHFAMCLSRFTCPEERALCRSSPIRLLQNVLMIY